MSGRVLLKFFLWSIFWFVVVLIVGLVGLLVYRAIAREELRNKGLITTPTGIQSVEKIQIGGVDQWISIRSQDPSLPVLLWLHGGPGSSDMALGAKFDMALTNTFTIVHWDQRGAGKSYSATINPHSMTTEQFVADTLLVTDYLRNRFNQEKIYLAGHSWGTKLGIHAITKAPEKYKAYVGIGQVVASNSDEIGYAFALSQAKATNNMSAITQLEKIGPPPWQSLGQFAIYTRWIDAYGGTGRQFSFFDYLGSVATSPDYSLPDLYHFFQGQQFSVSTMFANNQLYDGEDFPQTHTTIAIPVYFFQGRYDYNTPSELVEKYYEVITAPEKKLVWFENSAHFPHWEEPEKFIAELQRVVAN
jgi:pimeloyl-ACP methyl ester carboxylesterase